MPGRITLDQQGTLPGKSSAASGSNKEGRKGKEGYSQGGVAGGDGNREASRMDDGRDMPGVGLSEGRQETLTHGWRAGRIALDQQGTLPGKSSAASGSNKEGRKGKKGYSQEGVTGGDGNREASRRADSRDLPGVREEWQSRRQYKTFTHGVGAGEAGFDQQGTPASRSSAVSGRRKGKGGSRINDGGGAGARSHQSLRGGSGGDIVAEPGSGEEEGKSRADDSGGTAGRDRRGETARSGARPVIRCRMVRRGIQRRT